MARKRKAPWQRFLISDRYGDGTVETIGTISGRPGEWTIRYSSISELGGKQESVSVTSTEMEYVQFELFRRWWPEQRKLDAKELILASERYESWTNPELRPLSEYLVFDAIKGSEPSARHSSLDNAIAKWEWWDTVGREIKPPLGFSCTCRLLSVTSTKVRRMLESGQGYDLEATRMPTEIIDPDWKAWSREFLEVYTSLRRMGLPTKEAQSKALLRADSVVNLDASHVAHRLCIGEVET